MPRDSANAISADELIKAYGLGYFPMARARDDDHVVWVLPDERGVIMLDQFRAPKRLLRFLKTHPFEIRIDSDFSGVINACAEHTNSREDTWINDAIIEAYTELHLLGRAHSVECWLDGKLVGGLYGVTLGAAFCGESMFSRETNASKIALLYLATILRDGGFHFIDAQFYNEHLEQFGLVGIPDENYQALLSKAVHCNASFKSSKEASSEFVSSAPSAERVWQSITQTS